MTLSGYFLRLEMPGLPDCYPLISPFSSRGIMLPREKGRHSYSITASELRRGVVPKLVRQHILLILILRISDLLLLLLSCISRVRLCATPSMEAHQAPLSLGFSRQEHWSGLPFPSQMHESET